MSKIKVLEVFEYGNGEYNFDDADFKEIESGAPKKIGDWKLVRTYDPDKGYPWNGRQLVYEWTHGTDKAALTFGINSLPTMGYTFEFNGDNFRYYFRDNWDLGDVNNIPLRNYVKTVITEMVNAFNKAVPYIAAGYYESIDADYPGWYGYLLKDAGNSKKMFSKARAMITRSMKKIRKKF